MKKLIKEHYRNTNSLKLPSNPQYRQFRIKRLDGSFNKIPRQIHTLKELKVELDKFEGDIKDIYYTTCLWANPEEIGAKERQKGFMPRMVGADLCFDIDSDGTWEGLEEARQQAVQLVDWLKKQPGIIIDHIRFSNKKGFHIITKEAKLKLPKAIGDRIAFLEDKRKLFINKIPSNINIDQKVTTNPLGIIKLIGSLNTENGFRTQEITINQLQQPIHQLQRNLRRLNYQIKKELNAQKIKYRKNTPEKETQEAEEETVTYIKNKVPGLKDRYTLILKYPKKTPFVKLDTQLRYLNRKYPLANWYILEDQHNIYAMNNKTSQPDQITKILQHTEAINAKEQNKYTTLRMPINCQLIGIIETTYNNTYISAPHQNWLIKYHNTTPELNPTHGNPNTLLITQTQVRRYNHKVSETQKVNDGISFPSQEQPLRQATTPKLL